MNQITVDKLLLEIDINKITSIDAVADKVITNTKELVADELEEYDNIKIKRHQISFYCNDFELYQVYCKLVHVHYNNLIEDEIQNDDKVSQVI